MTTPASSRLVTKELGSSRDHAQTTSDGHGNPTLADRCATPVVGFTGTREGLTSHQKSALTAWFSIRPRGELHHGDCVGADASAHETALYHGWRIEAHPGLVPDDLRYFATGCAKVHPARPTLERNSDILMAVNGLLACPQGPETRRSGTWSTIRKARRLGMPITILWPNGSVTVEPLGDGAHEASTTGADAVPGTNILHHQQNGGE